MQTARRWGITYKDGESRMMLGTVTGEMSDGRKVWTECDGDRNLIDMDTQYVMETRGGWTEFVRM